MIKLCQLGGEARYTVPMYTANNVNPCTRSTLHWINASWIRSKMNSYTIDTPVKEIINSGYGDMVKSRLRQGWDGYLISFMFNRARGSRPSVIRQMHREVERIYSTVLTRIIRDPRKVPIVTLPLWIVCPDYPVPKHAKQSLRDVTVNDGLH